MNNLWAFAPMQASNDLLDDPDALRERLDQDGYLLFRKLLDPERIAGVRRDVTAILAEHGWIAGGDETAAARAVGRPLREGEDGYFTVYDEIQKLESFHTLAHDAPLLGTMRAAVGDSAFPHPLKVARLSFPSAPQVTTPPHQDYLNNQGTPELTAAWIPLGDCPRRHGPLAVLRGSHRHGLLPLEFHLGAGNRQAVLPTELLEQCTWVTTDMEAGDVLVFGAFTVHASLHNGTANMRLSIDFRYQPEGQPLTEMVLEPHFGRLSWDEIYAGWGSDELQYYWRDLDYSVVPFDRNPFEESAPTEQDLWRVALYEEFLNRRYPSGAA